MTTKIQVKICGREIEIERRDGKYIKPDILKRLEGINVALKPAHETICVARKPISEKTVAANVLRWGVGGLNIDGCRIPGSQRTDRAGMPSNGQPNSGILGAGRLRTYNTNPQGRWPANFVLSHSPYCQDGRCVPCCPVRLLDEQSGQLTSGKMRAGQRRKVSRGRGGYGDGFPDEATHTDTPGDTGGASRFFYCAKASRKERNAGLEGTPKTQKGSNFGMDGPRPHTKADYKYSAEVQNRHPTVKPANLMRWLVRLVTPPDGLVLDPFMGSGTTGMACVQEEFQFIGIEKEPEYVEIARRRIAWAEKQKASQLF